MPKRLLPAIGSVCAVVILLQLIPGQTRAVSLLLLGGGWGIVSVLWLLDFRSVRRDLVQDYDDWWQRHGHERRGGSWPFLVPGFGALLISVVCLLSALELLANDAR